jgi:hypothetical protein
MVMNSINRKRARKLREILKMVEGPIQSNWLYEWELLTGVGGTIKPGEVFE